MARKKKERGEIWWLAHGHSTHSRQPSFAPATARPSITTSSYGFGWHRQKACFISSQNHGMLSPTIMKEHPCDPGVALGILRRCAYQNVLTRFFENWYAQVDDVEIYASRGRMFRITLHKSRKSFRGGFIPAVAALHFYSPDNQVQSISFHNGMTRSFSQKIRGLKIADIRALMQ